MNIFRSKVIDQILKNNEEAQAKLSSIQTQNSENLKIILSEIKALREEINLLKKEATQIRSVHSDVNSLSYRFDLFSTYFLDKSTATSVVAVLREEQLKRFEALKLVARTLQEQKITYWLDFGSLLGAVRHKGFVPWDNDIDIGVLESEKDRLMDALKNLFGALKGYKLIDASEIRNYVPGSFFKVVSDNMDYEYLDIFPYLPYNEKQLICKWTYETEKRASEGFIRHYDAHPISNGTIFPLNRLFFEGFSFFCPNDPKRYLGIIYGNWQALPQNEHDIGASRDRNAHLMD